ncbi:hypothetical protein XBO1_1240028 [Xenorhabdus bovienii str. oregonense]|uniref:Uncharacterized protein n=1 Tax=Xenorhabdus bovienii str. oregonense TaxID=1398202 RepID=A0A077NQF6_XENBV|nr:hypothetical protein XBO1_1240028 [Xenorhabdus bovienii str. oregonense]
MIFLLTGFFTKMNAVFFHFVLITPKVASLQEKEYSPAALITNKLQHPGSQSHVSFWLEQYSALIVTDGGQNEDF